MKNLFLYILISFLSIISCKSPSHIRNEYKSGHIKNIYIVDTIEIDTPVVFTFEGKTYVCPNHLLEKNRMDYRIFDNPQMFLCMDLCNLLELRAEDLFKYAHENCDERDNCNKVRDCRINGKSISVYQFEGNVQFLLGLINVEFYNSRMVCLDCNWKRIKDKHHNISYRQVVFPFSVREKIISHETKI